MQSAGSPELGILFFRNWAEAILGESVDHEAAVSQDFAKADDVIRFAGRANLPEPQYGGAVAADIPAIRCPATLGMRLPGAVCLLAVRCNLLHGPVPRSVC
jgi:hypothetical protein